MLNIADISELVRALKLAAASQRKDDLFFGYIRELRACLPENNPYYNMTDDIKHVCASYIYWFHFNLTDKDSIVEKPHHFIIKQQKQLEIGRFTCEIMELMETRFGMDLYLFVTQIMFVSNSN